MADPKEINLAIKESLDLFFQQDDPARYVQPIQTMDDLVGKGLLNPDGTATSKGLLFTTLQDAGAVDATGTLTEKGRAYSMPYDDTEKGVLHPANREAYKLRWSDEIDRPSRPLDENVKTVFDYAWDAGAGLAKSAYYGIKFWDVDEDRPKQVIAGASLIDNSIKANKEMGKLIDMGFAWVRANQVFDGDENEKQMEEELWVARQNQDRLRFAHQALKTGQVMESVFELEGVADAVVKAKDSLPPGEGDFLDKQVGAGGQMITGDQILPAAFAIKAATAAPLATRAILKAQQIIGRTAALDAKIAAMQTAKAAGETVLKKEAMATPRLTRLTGNLTARGATEEAAKASTMAARIAEDAAKARSALPSLTAELEAVTAQRAALATRIPEAAAQKVIQTMELGRKMQALPANAIGATLERVGNTLSRTDAAISGFLKDKGLDQLYSGAIGAAGVLGFAGNPALGAIGAGAAVLKTGKILEQAGKMFRYVGKEMAQARGQIPFWKRVAAHTAPGTANRALAHTFGIFELGGATTDILRRTGRGIAAAAPVDLAFEWLGDGADMRRQTVYQALSESLVLGGSFAAGGGIFMGTKARMRELSLGDKINFMQGLVDPNQKALFQAIPGESQRAIATYSVANPTLNFQFSNKGASHYDPNTNTATINVTSTNPIKPLVAHEVLHHTILKNNMEGLIAGLFLGDTKGGTTGGLLRGKDGTLDPKFGEFVETYNRRMDNAGAQRPTLDQLAVEYFIEQHSDQYADMAESGALGAQASRGAARRWMGGVLDTLLPKAPVLKDLHFKMGGAIDANGAMVMGNGLLADGIRQLPAAQKMFKDMNRRSAGMQPGQFEPLGTDKAEGGASIALDPANTIDIGLMHPLIQVDTNGNPILKDGKPVAIDKATDLLRGAAGITVMEELRKNKAAGKRYAPGEMHLDDNGDVQGRWLSPETLREVIGKNKFNPEQAQVIRSINSALKTGDGNRMVVINFPATKKLKNGKIVYAPQAATIRDIVPVGLTVTKDGNMLIGLMSVTKLQENIAKRAQSKRGKRLYGGNVDLILQDVRAMMDYHKQGVDSLEHFAKKYGAVEADERKKFINTMFGLLNKTEQAALNPLLLEDGVTSKDNVYRTYRVDRVSKAVPLNPDEHPAMPFNYEASKQVKMPGMPSMPDRYLPEAVDALYLPAVKAGDMDTAQRMVDEAAKAAGYDVDAWHGTTKDFDEFDSSLGIHVGTEEQAKFRLKDVGPVRGGKPRVIKVALSTGNALRLNDVGQWENPVKIIPQLKKLGIVSDSESDRIRRMAKTNVDEAFSMVVENIQDAGYDSIIYRNKVEGDGDSRILFRPEQLKSTDPVTRDESGNVIPLSKRFDSSKDDLRYLPEAVGMIPGSRVTGANVPASIADKQSMVSLELLAPHLAGAPRAAKRAGAYMQTVAKSITDAAGLRDLAGDIKNEADAQRVLGTVVERLAANLENLYNAIPEELRNQWKEWYVIANDWSSVRASRMADSHRDVVAGMIARLSPGKDWFHNITMVDHLIDTINANPVLSQSYTKHLVDREIYAWRQTTPGRKASRQKETALRKQATSSMEGILSKHYGRKFSDILIEDAPAAARFARAYSEMELDQRVKDHTDKVVTNADGSAQKLSWQSFSNISKALEIYQYPSRNRISELLGDDHKIRSFYNNIVDPFDTEFLDVTIDTHAVAAALLAPLSQKAPEVSAAFGGTVSPEDMKAFGIQNQTGKNKADSGLSGNYAIYADAYRLAAQRLGILPRELQSITWEGIRAFYPGPLKRDAGIVAQIRGLLNSTEPTKIQQIDEITNQWHRDHPDANRARLSPLSASSLPSTRGQSGNASQKAPRQSSATTSQTTETGQNTSATTRSDSRTMPEPQTAANIIALAKEIDPAPQKRMMPEPVDGRGKGGGMDATTWLKENRNNYVHINLKGNAIDDQRDFTGWVLPVEGSSSPNAISTKYGRPGLQAVLVPKEWVQTSRDRPARIKPGFRPAPEQIATITPDAMRENGTVDLSKVFQP